MTENPLLTPPETEPITVIDPTTNKPVTIDPTKVHQARVWDFYLGGKNHYPVDAEYGRKIVEEYPEILEVARQSREFMKRTVSEVTGLGIRQFLDIGTGLPTSPSVHEVAQSIAPDSRVVYVDIDPLVLVHARAMLSSDSTGDCAYLLGDVREPERIFQAAAKVLDLSQPYALIIMGVMGTVPDDQQVFELMRRYVDALPSGSFLILNDGCRDANPEGIRKFEHANESNDGYVYVPRPTSTIRRYFDGLEILEPGIVSITQWRPEATRFGPPPAISSYGGVGYKE